MPESSRPLIEHDDSRGGGQRNPTKRCWFDLEIVGGVAVQLRAGVNELDQGRTDKLAAAQKLAFFPTALQPTGGTTVKEVVLLDRKAGLEAYAAAEAPWAVRRRRWEGKPRE